MDEVFVKQFGPQGPMPLREPLRHEVETFYKNTEATNAHAAMGELIATLSGKPVADVDALKLTVLRRGQAYLLHFINHEPPAPDTSRPLTIELDKAITNLNGSEAWESFTLEEPDFLTFKAYYDKREQKGDDEAMAWLIAELSGVNPIALKKIPITQYVVAQSYLAAFLRFFPKKDAGKTS